MWGGLWQMYLGIQTRLCPPAQSAQSILHVRGNEPTTQQFFRVLIKHKRRGASGEEIIAQIFNEFTIAVVFGNIKQLCRIGLITSCSDHITVVDVNSYPLQIVINGPCISINAPGLPGGIHFHSPEYR